MSELSLSGREADHSPSFRVEIKNEWSYTSAPPYVVMAWIGTTLIFFKN